MVSSRHILFVIAPERFRDEELFEPRNAVERDGHHVTTVSTKPGIAVGMLGAREVVARSISDAARESVDLVVIVGGTGSPDHLWNHEPLLDAARRHYLAGGPIAAICLSGAVLARAGILLGRRATVYPSPRARLALKRGGAVYVDEPLVRDGRIVTASGPEAASAFGVALVSLLRSA